MHQVIEILSKGKEFMNEEESRILCQPMMIAYQQGKFIIYSGKQIADNESEYLNFKRDMQDWYNLQVICYR